MKPGHPPEGTDKASANVSSWKDLAKPELKGRVMLASITSNQGLAQLFMLDCAHGGLPATWPPVLLNWRR